MADWNSLTSEKASERAPKNKTPRIALAVGCSVNVVDDVIAALKLFTPSAIYCVKLAGVYWPGKFETFITLHPEAMDAYEAERKAKGFPSGYEIVAPDLGNTWQHNRKGNISRRVDYRWNGMNASASSGIYAAKVAIEDGYKVVLAGIPMDKQAGHFLPGTKTIVAKTIRGPVWLERDTFNDGFQKSIPHLRGKVKSMSGTTRQIFGAPTPEWLAENQSLVSAV